jgi:hypothetical protein
MKTKSQGAKNVLSVMERLLAKQIDFQDLSGCRVIVEKSRFRVRRGLRRSRAPEWRCNLFELAC